MGTALIKLKIMPSGIDVDLEQIKKQGREKIESQGAEVTKYEEEPIAFGLKAIIAFISIDESKETDFIENTFSQMPEVTSAEVIDYRRAI